MNDVLHENKHVNEPKGLGVRNKLGFATIDSCFVLIGTRQCGVAENKPLNDKLTMKKLQIAKNNHVEKHMT